jgi:hypothetical protein
VITQRIAVISKSVLSQLDLLVALRTGESRDPKAIDSYWRSSYPLRSAAGMRLPLPALPVGTPPGPPPGCFAVWASRHSAADDLRPVGHPPRSWGKSRRDIPPWRRWIRPVAGTLWAPSAICPLMIPVRRNAQIRCSSTQAEIVTLCRWHHPPAPERIVEHC